MTLVAAAVCPHPPLLVPEVGRAEPVAARPVAVDAVRSLRDAGPDVIVVLGDAPAAAAYGPGAGGSLAGFGVDRRVELAAATSDPLPGLATPAGSVPELTGSLPALAVLSAPPERSALPLSLTIGAWLLEAAGWSGPRGAVGVPATASSGQAAALGARLAAGSGPGERLALLVMGDGSARRTLKAPGGLDPRAEAFDAAAAAALAAGDAAALLALDPALGRELLAAGRASWQVLAGARGATSHDDTDRLGWTSDLRYDDAPYGVGYLVAVWMRGVAESDGSGG